MPCLRCRGKRHASCDSCGGRGSERQTCLACDGAQGFTSYLKGKLAWKCCDVCRGDGHVDLACSDCQGCGFGREKKPCPDCSGIVKRHVEWLPHARLTTVDE